MIRSVLDYISGYSRLMKELENYKHAFETTALDRDRLAQALYKSDSPPKQIDDDAGLGRYWQAPTDLHKTILASKDTDDRGRFLRLIETGFVLQHALIRNEGHIDRLIQWQADHLAHIGMDLVSLDDQYQELDIVPHHTLRTIKGKRVGSDFLRFLEYLKAIEDSGVLADGGRVIEIGSGYGGLARLIRLRYPKTQVVLVDIYETLAGAEIYLRHAFPECTLARAGTPEANTADFVLCRIEDADAIVGTTFDLAVNTWSFGEMPNHYINKWFEFLTRRNDTRALFLINHFMMPLCLESPTARSQMKSGRWLPLIDDQWDIVDFTIHPGVHACEYWRHCQQGVRVIARKFADDASKATAREHARQQVKNIFLEDWAQFSVLAPLSQGGDLTALRAQLMARDEIAIDDDVVFDLTQVERIIGILKDDIRYGKDCAFFRLWDAYRLDGSHASLRLLRILLHLRWRPSLKDLNSGTPYTVIAAEDYQFGTLAGAFDDDKLIIPAWLSKKIDAIMHSA